MPLAPLKIVLKAGQAEVAFSVEEARELFEQLRSLLGEPAQIIIREPAPPIIINPVCPAPAYPDPWQPTWSPWPEITCDVRNQTTAILGGVGL